MAEPHWLKAFARENRPGAYLRVVEPGDVKAGDTVKVVDRPEHGVTIAIAFRAYMTEPQLIPGSAACPTSCGTHCATACARRPRIRADGRRLLVLAGLREGAVGAIDQPLSKPLSRGISANLCNNVGLAPWESW
jgi:MOSC domain